MTDKQPNIEWLRAENDRLRKAMQDAIKEADQPSYGDPFAALDYYHDAICIIEKALEGK